MNFIKRNYSLVALLCALAVGIVVFSMSFRLSKDGLIEQTARTIQVSTNVKRQLMETKLYSLEQEMNLLSKNDMVQALLSPAAEKNAMPKPGTKLNQYIKGILDNRGYSSMMLIRQSGELAYASNPSLDKTSIPSVIDQFAQQRVDTLNSTLTIVLSQKEPYEFYLSKRILDAQGIFRGTLFMEIPREFLSVELPNTISLDSLKSYLISSQGITDQHGRIQPDTCISCKWSKDAFIIFSSPEKIEGTWKVVSVYPISEIAIRHFAYLAIFDGLIALFVAMGVIMVIVYCLQLIQKAKGITQADILLVQTTWNTVSEYSDKIISGFYKYLFEAAPEVKPMFKSSEADRQKRMALMINTIVNSADSLEEFKGSISQLAKRHTHMGVKREYFPIVVKAIISSVADQHGKNFTPAHRKSWYKILNQVSAIMIEEMETYQRVVRNAAA